MTDREEGLLPPRSYQAIACDVCRVQHYQNALMLCLELMKHSDNLDELKEKILKVHESARYEKYTDTLELMKRDMGTLSLPIEARPFPFFMRAHAAGGIRTHEAPTSVCLGSSFL